MFNQRLREMRMKREITQQRMSELLNIALRSYQCYEGGDRNPSFDTLINIADILDVSIDYLLGRDNFLKVRGVPSGE